MLQSLGRSGQLKIGQIDETVTNLGYTRWAEDASRYRTPSRVQFDYSRTNAVELVFSVSF